MILRNPTVFPKKAAYHYLYMCGKKGELNLEVFSMSTFRNPRALKPRQITFSIHKQKDLGKVDYTVLAAKQHLPISSFYTPHKSLLAHLSKNASPITTSSSIISHDKHHEVHSVNNNNESMTCWSSFSPVASLLLSTCNRYCRSGSATNEKQVPNTSYVTRN